jgi:agmatinase
MADSILSHVPPERADALVIGVPYGEGASFGQGAARGPAAIIECLHSQIEFFERHTRTEPASDFSIGHLMLGELEGLAPEAMVATVAERLQAFSSFVLTLGGTHAVSIGPLQALARRLDPREVTILAIDAHLDLREDDSDYNDVAPSRFAHSCVMRRAHELGFNLCAVGIRAYARGEWAYAQHHRLPVFEWGRGPEPALEEVLGSIPTRQVYLSIDVDGFDPAVMPATGTPVPGGLSWAYGTDLMRRLFLEKEVVGADVVETAPDGISGLTEYAAAQLCYDVLGYGLLKRAGRLRFV